MLSGESIEFKVLTAINSVFHLTQRDRYQRRNNEPVPEEHSAAPVAISC